MFCEHCGIKIEDRAEFCQNCGRKTNVSSTILQEALHGGQATVTPLEDIFYSKEWARKKFFALVSMPYFDVAADRQCLYLIRLPSYSGQTWGFFIGLVVLNIIGAAIGSEIGASSDAKKRQWYRSAWVDSENNLTSRAYDRDVYMRIPLADIKNTLVLKPNKFDAEYGGKKLTLKKNKVEMERLIKFMDNHVL